MKPFRLDIDSTSAPPRVSVSGVLDETARFPSVSELPEAHLVFDLSGVERVTSSGTRQWVKFIRTLEEAGKAFVLERCSVAVVIQLNIVPSFRGQGTVGSIYAPFYCAHCGAQRTELFEVQSDLPAMLAAPLPCQKCAADMELDDMPERFLAFLGS